MGCVLLGGASGSPVWMVDPGAGRARTVMVEERRRRREMKMLLVIMAVCFFSLITATRVSCNEREACC